jgi:transposase-like protein
MKIKCPSNNCSSYSSNGPKNGRIVRHGSFYRKSDSRQIRRFFCLNCQSSFSNATLRPDCYQKKRRVNFSLNRLYNSGISQRRLALFLSINRKTVARKIRFLANEERKRQESFLEINYKNRPVSRIQFDDLETSEHTKCKPLSVTLAVDPETRKILSFQVSTMPARGPLAKVSRRKYGLPSRCKASRLEQANAGS